MNDADRFTVLLKHVASTDSIVFTWFYSLIAVTFATAMYLVFYICVSYFASTHLVALSLLGAAVIPYVIVYSLTWLVVAAGIAGLVLPEISGVDAIEKSSNALHKTARSIAVPTVMVVATIHIVDFIFGFRAPVILSLAFLGLLLGIAAWAKKFEIKDTFYMWYSGIIFFMMMPVLVAQYAMTDLQKVNFQETITGIFGYLWTHWQATLVALVVLWVIAGNPFKLKAGEKT